MRRGGWSAAVALAFGVWLSFTYVNPYGGSLSLSYLTLQLSGARGEFVLEPNMQELLSLTLRMVPSLVFQAWAGTAFYRHYCVASVYIFSRIPRRGRWYGREAAALALRTLLYQAALLLGAVVTAALRWDLTLDGPGVKLLLVHLLMWSLWTYAFTMGVNLLAIYWGSGEAFAALAGAQLVCVALLAVLRPLGGGGALLPVLKRADPVTCLILCWQTSRSSPLGGGIYWEDSLGMVLGAALAVTGIGALAVARHDLLTSDEEGG